MMINFIIIIIYYYCYLVHPCPLLALKLLAFTFQPLMYRLIKCNTCRISRPCRHPRAARQLWLSFATRYLQCVVGPHTTAGRGRADFAAGRAHLPSDRSELWPLSMGKVSPPPPSSFFLTFCRALDLAVKYKTHVDTVCHQHATLD